jgi:hypothetical protein
MGGFADGKVGIRDLKQSRGHLLLRALLQMHDIRSNRKKCGGRALQTAR